MIVGLYSTVEEVLILIIASSRRLQTGLTGASGKRLRSLARAPTSKLCKRTAMALRRFRASNRGWRTIGTLRQQQIKASSVVRSSVCRTTHCFRAERWHGVTRNRKATRPTILLSHIHLRQSSTDPTPTWAYEIHSPDRKRNSSTCYQEENINRAEQELKLVGRALAQWIRFCDQCPTL